MNTFIAGILVEALLALAVALILQGARRYAVHRAWTLWLERRDLIAATDTAEVEAL